MDGVISVLRTFGIFGAAAVCEIAGGWLVWKAMRDGRPGWWGLLGVILLILFGAIVTLQTSHFGRIFAAYGGIFVAMSLLWGWGVDGNRPDLPDWIGGAVVLAGVGLILYWPRPPQQEQQPDASGAGRAAVVPFDAQGKTQPVPGRVGTISAVAGHPVRQVLVVPGDRVKAGQPLVRLGTDDGDLQVLQTNLAEAQARLERRRANPPEAEQAEARTALESAQADAQEARQTLERLEPAWRKGEVADAPYRKARSDVAVREAEQRVAAARLERLLKQPADLEVAELEARVAAAKAAVDAAREGFQQVAATAPIAGLVSRLDVRPGMTAEAGAAAWEEILDLSEIDVRCDLTPQQADTVAVGDAVEVTQEGVRDGRWAGQVVNVGAAADQQTGKVPVLVRVKNGGERLRCYVEVSVHFGGDRPGDEAPGVPAVESKGMSRNGRDRTPLRARV